MLRCYHPGFGEVCSVGKKQSSKKGRGFANEPSKAPKKINDERVLPAAIRSAVVFAAVTVYYAIQSRWWMVAIFSSITLGFSTNALSHVYRNRPPAKRAFSYAYYFFFFLSVAMSIYGAITKRF
jgi:heme O synthase-like polyprenyltransferase